MASLAPPSPETSRRNLRTGAFAFAGALAMLGLGYASVPLYRLFCQVTGFGGTTMQATESDAARAATSSRVYWQTHETNAAGRQLYDKLAKHQGFIVYAHEL